MAIERADPRHLPAIRLLLAETGWEHRYVRGQLDAVERAWSEPCSAVFVSRDAQGCTGFVSARLSRWNMLGRIEGLVVHPLRRRRGHGSALVAAAESFLEETGARGLYVDTPVSNRGARAFYERCGYTQDHVMSRYYADDLDGVTYARFFS